MSFSIRNWGEWAARRAAEVLNRKSAGRFEAVFLSGELNRRNSSENETYGTKLILNTGKLYRDIFPLSWERIDILLSIDYRPSYNTVINALPRTPLIVWVRDPHRMIIKYWTPCECREKKMLYRRGCR